MAAKKSLKNKKDPEKKRFKFIINCNSSGLSVELYIPYRRLKLVSAVVFTAILPKIYYWR